MNINKTWIGLVAGFVLPIVTTLLFYKFAYKGTAAFFDFLHALLILDSVAILLAVSCLSNLAVFLVVAYMNKIALARGLFMMTMFYAIVVVVLKFAIQ